MNAQAPTNQAPIPPKQDVLPPLQRLTIGDLMQDPRVVQAVSDAAPKHLTPERFLRVMTQAIRKTPKLAQCDPLSLLGAMITCASLGLEPNTPLGLAYLIPFEKRGKSPTGQWETQSVEIQVILGYQGLIDLSRRTGSLVAIHADVVYEGDEFSYEYGSQMHLRHKPHGSREGRKAIYAYAHAKLDDGEAFEVLPYEEVLRIRDNTQAYKQAIDSRDRKEKNWDKTPWIAYEHEMACKTMVRRVSKWLPKSVEFATAVQMDALSERGLIDFKAIAQHPSLASDPFLASVPEESDEDQGSPTVKPSTPKTSEFTRQDTPAPAQTKANNAAQAAAADRPAPQPQPAQQPAQHPAALNNGPTQDEDTGNGASGFSDDADWLAGIKEMAEQETDFSKLQSLKREFTEGLDPGPLKDSVERIFEERNRKLMKVPPSQRKKA